MTTIQTTPTAQTRSTIPATAASGQRADDAFTSGGTTYDTLAGVATRLAALAVEDTLNGPSEERALERVTLVEHLMRFANAHGSTRPAAAVRRAMAGMQFALGQPGTPVLSVVEELQIATSQTQ
jgi:hypothetical protein